MLQEDIKVPLATGKARQPNKSAPILNCARMIQPGFHYCQEIHSLNYRPRHDTNAEQMAKDGPKD